MMLCSLLMLTCVHLVLSDRSVHSELPPEKSDAAFLRSGGSGDDPGSPLLLTPFIEQNKLKEAREAAKVDSTYFLNDVESYAGYFTVNKEYNANLYFWYIPVPNQSVEETPWIIWLQGGPGASSLYGLFEEIGPFVVTNDNVQAMPYTWNQNHSLVFIDNPVGTGYSFTDDDRGYATNQTTIGENLYSALQQFLTIFPELRKAPLTIAGESYAGKHVPSIGIQIHWHKEKDEPINLQNLAIGNGFIDPVTLQGYGTFANAVGIIDENVADYIKLQEENVAKSIQNGDYDAAYESWSDIFETIESSANWTNDYNYLQYRNDTDDYTFYIQKTEVRRALHVGNTTYTDPYNNNTVRSKLTDFMHSAKKWLEELLDNYRVMLYNGHLDIIVCYHASVNTYKSLNFSGSSDYAKAQRFSWLHDGHLAGYYKIAGNLTEVLVRNAGHMVPRDQPAPAMGLISAFVRGLPLDETGYLSHRSD